MNVSSHYWSPFHANDCVFSRNEQQKVLTKNRNKRSDHLATRETASYILFSAKTQIYINKTHTESGVEKSLFQFSLRLLI